MVIHNRSGKNWNTQYVFARYQQYKAYSSKFILTETVISNLKKWLYFTRNFLRLFNTFAMNSDRICDVWYCRICRACSSLLIHVYFHFAQNLVTTVLYTVLHCLKAHFVIMGYHANLMQCCCRDLFQVLRPRPWPSGLETKTETLVFRSRDRDRDLDKMNSSVLESRDHGLEITTLVASIPIDDRALT